MRITRGFQKHPGRIGAGGVRRHPGAVRGERHRGRAALAQGLRAGLAHRRVRDAALGHQHPQRPRVGEGPGRRAHARDQPADRPLAARRASTCGRSARTRSRWTATSCRPTAAPAPRRSPAPTSRWPTPSPGWARTAGWPTRSRCPARSRPSASGWWTARVRLDLPYEEDSRAEVDTNVVATDTGALIEVQGTGEGATFSRAAPSTPCSTPRWPASTSSAPLQAEALAGPTPGAAMKAAAGHPQRRASSPSCSGMLAGAGGCRWSGWPTSPSSPRPPRPARRSPRTRWPRPATRPPRPGCPRSPTTPGWPSTPSTACPACCPRAGPGATATTPRNLELLLGQLGDVPDERRGAAFVCAAALVVPGRHRDRRARRVARPDRPRPRAAPTASATTRSSCRTARSAPPPS